MTYEEAERKVRSENCILPSAIIKDKEDDPNAPIIFYTEEEIAAMENEQMEEATRQARKRKNSGANPISCLVGLKRRVIENNDIL